MDNRLCHRKGEATTCLKQSGKIEFYKDHAQQHVGVGQIAFEDRDKFLSQYAEKIDFFKFDTEKIASEIIKKVRTKQ